MRLRQFVLAAGLALPGAALAHSPIEGLGNLYNGLLHPVLVPAHLLMLIAMGLFLGQQGPKKNERALAAYLVSTLLGLVVAGFDPGVQAELFILGLTAVVGLLVAVKPSLAVLWSAILAALAGFSLGLDSAQESLVGKDKMVMLFGSGVAIYLITLYPMALAAHFNKLEWHRIAVRVVGSWIAASALLVLALSFVGTPQPA